jgi:predicted nucleic-acid-binding protein
VLNDTYKIGKAVQAEVVRELLGAPRIVVEREDIVRSALEMHEGDIADRIIHLCGVAGGCTKTVTFDKKFARLEGVELLA